MQRLQTESTNGTIYAIMGMSCGGGDFEPVPEDIGSREAPPVVEAARSENPDQGRLARVDVTDD